MRLSYRKDHNIETKYHYSTETIDSIAPVLGCNYTTKVQAWCGVTEAGLRDIEI